jgi:ribosomal protein L18E
MIKTLFKNMPHPTPKNPKIKKLIINLESIHETKKTDAWWPLGIKVQVQQQRSMIMNMKNIVHEIIYDEQIHLVKYKNTTIYYSIVRWYIK